MVGHRVARRQGGQLYPPAGKEGVAPDEKNIGPLAHGRCERRVDLAAGAGVEDPAASASRTVVSVFAAAAGLTSIATRVAAGRSSRRISSLLATASSRPSM